MEISLSVALVTRNRPDSLDRTLASLARQSVQPFETLVSDDSDSEAMRRVNQEIAQSYGCGYLQGPQKGLYANRNFVAKHCAGTHFRTMDDDHEFPDHHIAACLRAIKRDEQAIWTIGEYYPTEKERPLPPPIPGQLHPRGFSYVPHDMSQYCGISCGASIYPRAVVKRNILNLELYKFGILYLEYGARLLKAGFRVKHLPDTYVIHHYDENNRSVSSIEITDSARIFSMLMLSFVHQPSARNKLLTLRQIASEIFRRHYSIALVVRVSEQFKNEVKKLRTPVDEHVQASTKGNFAKEPS
ncbi:glycosyltransferase family 2 protein [Hymenobacter sp. HDW8]|uniref:glycosyltransferase family 2 protein n=1 Tax=Hymenobacter sp. HDW8 TaxID=2714932 RepID=UPI00140C916C|nr:glycosyltransferase family 2 protein [Hymenobacter sp. HDW8]QIL75339.1 glycosyltransferase family 2 protein [Hymenobacter sp. HDW8]